MSILKEELITNHLLLDYFDLWDEFDIRKVDDPKTVRYYELLMNHIQNQIDAGIKWLESDEARDYFYGESQYQTEVFRALEDEWDDILSNKYPSVEALLSEVYRRGKAKGYSDIRERIQYTDADKFALRIARDYNYHLIRKIDNDTRSQIKNKITEAVIAGEHPYTVAPKILDVAEERLKGSNFTPKQRATMIARTEISRVQNTGILQSYVNEGYTEVKILTAGDSSVCNLCLHYAFEFEEDAEIIYENRGEERTHNIIKLIEGGNFPPFHPLCRCTYLSVWGTKRTPPENPKIIDLTPNKFAVFNSYTENQSDIEWVMIKDKNAIYVDLPENVKETIVDFESLSPIFTQMRGEAGISYNLTKNTKTELKTNDDPIRVTLQVRTDDPNDILSVSHHHSDGGPPSFKDVRRCLDYTNNVKYANIHGPNDIFIMESREKVIPKDMCERLERAYWDCIVEANFTYKSKGKPFNDVAKEIIINNEKLNKYIKFYRCYK